jgi:hypothetical protein
LPRSCRKRDGRLETVYGLCFPSPCTSSSSPRDGPAHARFWNAVSRARFACTAPTWSRIRPRCTHVKSVHGLLLSHSTLGVCRLTWMCLIYPRCSLLMNP